MNESQDFTYPDDVSYSIQIPGVYDGVAVWVLTDGRVLNRFRGEESRRERMTDEYIRRSGRLTGRQGVG